MKNRLLFIILSISLLLFFSSCDQTPTTDSVDSKTSNEKSTQAYTELENLFAVPGDIENKNFTNAEKLYMDAVAADPSNATANFGAAFSHILATLSDTAVKNTINRWQGGSTIKYPPMFHFGIPSGTKDMTVPTQLLGSNLVKIIQTATSNPPTITEMQNLMRDKLLPRINYAIARLAVVETNPAFELRISGKMQGGALKKDVYLDLTEVYIMDAALHSMKSVVEQFLVFKFELASYTTKAAFAALQQNSTTFFVLASDGAARAQSVKSSLVGAVGKLRSGVNFLKSESDNQDDDIIKRGNDGVAVKDLDTMLVYLGKIESALTGTYSIEVKDADSDNNDYTITVSLNNFYNNLPQNPKSAWLPVYTIDSTSHGDLLFRWQAQDYASFTFPDPTFSGLFPGMTNETLKRIMYIDEAFAWRVEISLLDNYNSPANTTITMTINGTTYSPKSMNNWGYSTFYIANNNTQPVQSINIVRDGQNVPVEFFGKIPTVKLKSYSFIAVDLTRSPQNITATRNTSPNSVTVNLQQYANYFIERAVNNGSFVKIDSAYTSMYTDLNVNSGTTYQYRASRGYNLYSHDFFAQRANNYTNTVSITIP